MEEQQRGFLIRVPDGGLRGVFQVANGEHLESSRFDPNVGVWWQKEGGNAIRRAVAAYFKYEY